MACFYWICLPSTTNGPTFTFSFHPAKNEMKVGILDKVVLADGTELKQRVARRQGVF